jgi:hypothetical protein
MLRQPVVMTILEDISPGLGDCEANFGYACASTIKLIQRASPVRRMSTACVLAHNRLEVGNKY